MHACFPDQKKDYHCEKASPKMESRTAKHGDKEHRTVQYATPYNHYTCNVRIMHVVCRANMASFSGLHTQTLHGMRRPENKATYCRVGLYTDLLHSFPSSAIPTSHYNFILVMLLIVVIVSSGWKSCCNSYCKSSDCRKESCEQAARELQHEVGQRQCATARGWRPCATGTDQHLS